MRRAVAPSRARGDVRGAAQLRGVARWRARGRVAGTFEAEVDAGAVETARADGTGASRARARSAGARALRVGAVAVYRLAPSGLLRHARGAARCGRSRRARTATARAEPATRAGHGRPCGLLVTPLPARAPRA